MVAVNSNARLHNRRIHAQRHASIRQPDCHSWLEFRRVFLRIETQAERVAIVIAEDISLQVG